MGLIGQGVLGILRIDLDAKYDTLNTVRNCIRDAYREGDEEDVVYMTTEEEAARLRERAVARQINRKTTSPATDNAGVSGPSPSGRPLSPMSKAASVVAVTAPSKAASVVAAAAQSKAVSPVQI